MEWTLLFFPRPPLPSHRFAPDCTSRWDHWWYRWAIVICVTKHKGIDRNNIRTNDNFTRNYRWAICICNLLGLLSSVRFVRQRSPFFPGEGSLADWLGFYCPIRKMRHGLVTHLRWRIYVFVSFFPSPLHDSPNSLRAEAIARLKANLPYNT